jgi:hypothetical protein
MRWRVSVEKRLFVVIALLLAVAAETRSVHADGRGTNADTALNMSANQVYVAPEMEEKPYVHADDKDRMTQATTHIGSRGVPIKVGVIGHYPKGLRNPTEAAQKLRIYMDFSGIVILVTPKGMGISSDQLTNTEIARIEHRAGPGCRVEAGDCAITAMHMAEPLVLAHQSSENRNAAMFWAVSVGIFGLMIVGLIFLTRRKRGEVDDGALAPPPASVTPSES